MGRGLKTEPCETNESADAPKREPVFLEACRSPKKKTPQQESDVREDRQGPDSSGLCGQCVVKGQIWRGGFGLEGGGIYSSRERKVTV